MALTPYDIAKVGRDAGWSGTDLVVAVAVALAESGGDPNNHATRGEDSRGLWQINVSKNANPEYAGQNLYDPATNARVAHEIWSKHGWGPWSAHNTGAYMRYMLQATAGVDLFYNANPTKIPGDVVNEVTPQPIKDAAAAALEVAKVPVKILTWLTAPGTQMRIAKVMVGGGLVMLGLFIFARPVVEPAVKTAAQVGKVAALL